MGVGGRIDGLGRRWEGVVSEVGSEEGVCRERETMESVGAIEVPQSEKCEGGALTLNEAVEVVEVDSRVSRTGRRFA